MIELLTYQNRLHGTTLTPIREIPSRALLGAVGYIRDRGASGQVVFEVGRWHYVEYNNCLTGDRVVG